MVIYQGVKSKHESSGSFGNLLSFRLAPAIARIVCVRVSVDGLLAQKAVRQERDSNNVAVLGDVRPAVCPSHQPNLMSSSPSSVAPMPHSVGSA